MILVLVDRLSGFLLEPGLDRAGDDLAFRPRLRDPHVEAVDVAHAELRHLLVAVLHLAHGPAQAR